MNFNENKKELDVINPNRVKVEEVELKVCKKLFQIILVNIKRKTGINLIKTKKQLDRKIGFNYILRTGELAAINIALICTLINTSLVHAMESEIISINKETVIIEENNDELETLSEDLVVKDDIYSAIDNTDVDADFYDDLEVYEYVEEYFNTQVETGRIVIEEKQAGISGNNTPYDVFFSKWSKNSPQKALAEEWDQKGRTCDRGIAVVDGRYLVAMTTLFGKVGDNVDIVLRDGTIIPCKIADSKSYNDEMSSQYGHMLEVGNGNYAVDVVEWEIVGAKEKLDIADWRGQGVDYVITYTDQKEKTLIK